MIYLDESLLVGQSVKRRVYLHPHHPEWCIKVPHPYTSYTSLKEKTHERRRYFRHGNPNDLALKNFLNLKSSRYLRDFIVNLQPELVATNLGSGLVIETIRDDDGHISKRLGDGIKTKHDYDTIIKQLHEFLNALKLAGDFMFDLNAGNFLVQYKKNRAQLRLIDYKSINYARDLIPLAKWSEAFALHKMLRKERRLFFVLQNHYVKILGDEIINEVS